MPATNVLSRIWLITTMQCVQALTVIAKMYTKFLSCTTQHCFKLGDAYNKQHLFNKRNKICLNSMKIVLE
jgi:hypothetical protein